VDAYWFGFHLAFVSQAIELKKRGGKPSHPQPRFGEIVNQWLLLTVNRAYDAGCPDKIIQKLHQVKEEFNTPITGGRAETMQMWEKLSNTMQELVQLNLANPQMATARAFSTSGAKHPRVRGEAVAKLSEFAFLSFDDNMPDSPVVRAEFLTIPDRELSPNQTIEYVKDLSFLRALIWDRRGELEDAGLEHFGRLTSLEELRLNRTKITDKGLRYLKGLSRLTKLSLADSVNITNEGLKALTGLTQLEELDVTGTKVDRQGIDELKKKLPKLKKILPFDPKS
jgi:hypothetical protein